MTKPSLRRPSLHAEVLCYLANGTDYIVLYIPQSVPLAPVVPIAFLRSNYLVLPASDKTLDKTRKVTKFPEHERNYYHTLPRGRCPWTGCSRTELAGWPVQSWLDVHAAM